MAHVALKLRYATNSPTIRNLAVANDVTIVRYNEREATIRKRAKSVLSQFNGRSVRRYTSARLTRLSLSLGCAF